jgi:hypothetical protein
MEGQHCFPESAGCDQSPFVRPVAEYGRSGGCSVTGGYVYRGDDIPALDGVYLFADYCSPGIRGLQVDGATVIDSRTWDLPVEEVQSFGQGDDGELYLLLAGGPVLKLVAP